MAVDLRPGSRRYRQGGLLGLLAILVVIIVPALAGAGGGPATPQFGDPVDELWIVLAAALVLLSQAGLLAYGIGLTRPVHATSAAVKNLVDWAVGSLAFCLAGFGLLFGAGGVVGRGYWALDGVIELSAPVSGPTFLLFHLAVAGMAVTLISVGLVERASFATYVLFSAFVGLILYPVYAHWAWAGSLGGADGWLAAQGFRDFAGGTVVHGTAAWATLVGVLMVGPRMGRFGADGTVRPFEPGLVPLTALGTLILWFGWLGLTGGATLAFTAEVPRILLVTLISGFGGLLGAGSYAYLVEARVDLVAKTLGGAIAGLVAITAGADVIGPLGALAIGFVAGVLYDIGHEALLRLGIDDALGVIPAHGLAGSWGALALAVFAPAEALGRGNFEQLTIQALGVIVNLAWAAGASLVVFWLLRLTVGLRIAPEREQTGVGLDRDAVPPSNPQPIVSDRELAELLD